MAHRRTARNIIGLATLALLVAACGGEPSEATDNPATDEGEPKYGGELQFQTRQDVDDGYDPALARLQTAWIVNSLIFDTLVEVEPDGTMAPSLAEEWTISEDELTYTFKIREDVVFHNGREMTAKDAKYTIERIMDPETNSPRHGVFQPVESVEAPDDSTLVIGLDEPFAPLLSALADTTAGIVPQEVVEAEGGTILTNPVGTGPFKFVEWQVDRHVKVERNDDYWRKGLPYLDAITFSFNTDDNARTANLRSGTVDFLYDAPPELVDILRSDPGVATYGGEGTQRFQYLLLNMQREPFDDVRVRQAIYGALDREEIRQLSLPEATTPLNAGFLPETHWAGVTDVVYTQNYDGAAQLLEEAGYENGFAMEILVLAGSEFHKRTAQVIQEQLSPLGIEVTVTTVELGQLSERRNSGDFDANVTGFSGTIDPDERVTQTFVTGGGVNYAGFSDQMVDDLAEQARRTSDHEERAELYRQLQLRVAEVGPMAFIYNYHVVDAAQDYVKGYVFNPQLVDYRSIREVWLDNL